MFCLAMQYGTGVWNVAKAVDGLGEDELLKTIVISIKALIHCVRLRTSMRVTESTTFIVMRV
jgi:hypothetical protein